MIRRFKLWTMGVAVAGLTGLAQPSLADSQYWLAGVNMAGAEFGSKSTIGVLNRDYIYPLESDIDYFVNRGLTTFRLPFKWERLQPTIGGAFSAQELAQIDKVVNWVTGKKANVILDPHNYGGLRSHLLSWRARNSGVRVRLEF